MTDGSFQAHAIFNDKGEQIGMTLAEPEFAVEWYKKRGVVVSLKPMTLREYDKHHKAALVIDSRRKTTI